jgi:predicted nucleic acid-binding protein
MITSVDTNVLLDVMLPDPAYVKSSTELLRTAYNEGALIISHMVYAELVPQFGSRQALSDVLSRLGIETSPIDDEIAFLAGRKWKEYRKAGGSRQRILADFVIGAHGLFRADRFLTRDRGFYKTYFPELQRLGDG